ncbi:MAG: ATP synthase F1 subunit delta [Patescibacteria group bacterium]|jgi:F-type H+-transporting ATPase subunit delta
MRKITPKKYAQALYESLEGKDKAEIASAITSFIQVLVRNKSISKSDKVISAFQDYLNEQEGIQAVSVYSVKALHQEEKKEIKSGLKQALKKEIELIEYIDPELMGGVILKYGDVIVDGSVKNKIENLANTIG